MRKPTRPREQGRGERVLPGVWRLRLPLDLPGVPHVNAWALQAGDGIVLVDTGMHDRGTMGHLEQALERTGHRVSDIQLIVITHAHIDHCGQAPPLAERAGCEVWMHPELEAARARRPRQDDRDRAAQRRARAAAGALGARRAAGWAAARPARSTPTGTCVPGVTFETDAGTWNVIETPGHAPSHVCLHQPEQRVLLTGDHLMGRVSQYFDVGYTPDPVGEFLNSLDVTETARRAARARRPRPPVHGHPGAHRRQPPARSKPRVSATRAALADGPKSAYEAARAVYGDAFNAAMASWLITLTRAWLVHLQRLGEVLNDGGDPVEHWELAS